MYQKMWVKCEECSQNIKNMSKIQKNMIKILMYENCDLCKNITKVPKT